MAAYHFDYAYILRNIPLFLKGLVITLEISAVASVCALIWGLVLLLFRISNKKQFYMPAMGYIELVRNVPVLIQMYIIYFGLPSVGIIFSPFMCGVLALTIQNGGYLAEIYRGGVESISKTQYESGLALGMKKPLIMRKIILPQALKNVIPPVVNQLIILLKDSSLASSIAVVEITHIGKLLTERSGATYEVFITIAIIYILVTSIMSLLLNFYERRVRVIR
jgi:polar amino acid transport system permease protein